MHDVPDNAGLTDPERDEIEPGALVNDVESFDADENDDIPEAIETGLLDVAAAARAATPSYVPAVAPLRDRVKVAAAEWGGSLLIMILIAMVALALGPLVRADTTFRWAALALVTVLIANALSDVTRGGSFFRRSGGLLVRSANGDDATLGQRALRTLMRRGPELLLYFAWFASGLLDAFDRASVGSFLPLIGQAGETLLLVLIVETLIGCLGPGDPLHDRLAGTRLFAVNRRMPAPRQRSFEVVFPARVEPMPVEPLPDPDRRD